MTKPTVGRIVWFYEAESSPNDPPQAAIIAFVHTDTMVNLMVVNSSGYPRSHTSVYLRPAEAPAPTSAYCEWPPVPKA